MKFYILNFIEKNFQLQYNERLNQQQARYNIEITSLTEQLQEAENQRDLIEREVRNMYYVLRSQIILFLFLFES